MHDFKHCDHFIRKKESMHISVTGYIYARGDLSELGNSVRSIDIELLMEISPVKDLFNIHVIHAIVSGRFQSITNCPNHKWQGKKFNETCTLGA